MGWSCAGLGAVSPLTVTLTLLSPRIHCLELNTTVVEGMRRGRCLKTAPTNPSKLRGETPNVADRRR